MSSCADAPTGIPVDFETFDESQLRRYARHIVLNEVGGTGQAQLLNSRVLIIGAGGLGTPLISYLAAAGVGVIGICDDDRVDDSNLQRQVIHRLQDIGQPKVESAQRAVSELNTDVKVESIPERLTAANAFSIIKNYDVIADGSDNFATRYLVNDACHLAQKTLVSAAILRFDAQISTFKPHQGVGHPCYRCIFPNPPPAGLVPSCAEGGVLGAVAGVAGSLQATEVLKELLEIGDRLSGRLLIYDALSARIEMVAVPKNPDCPLCGENPTIRDLSSHATV